MSEPYIPELLETIRRGIDVLAVESPYDLPNIHWKLQVLNDTIYDLIALAEEMA